MNKRKLLLYSLAIGMGSLLGYALYWGFTHPYDMYCALYEPDGGWNC